MEITWRPLCTMYNTPPVQHQAEAPGVRTSDCPSLYKERINTGRVFLYLSLRCTVDVSLLSLFPSLSLSLSHPSLTSEALKCTPGPNRTEQPL